MGKPNNAQMDVNELFAAMQVAAMNEHEGCVRGGPERIKLQHKWVNVYSSRGRQPRLRLSPAASGRWTVDEWFARVGGALDGVVAKRLDVPYAAGTRRRCEDQKELHK